jgi:hypothetical protein
LRLSRSSCSPSITETATGTFCSDSGGGAVTVTALSEVALVRCCRPKAVGSGNAASNKAAAASDWRCCQFAQGVVHGCPLESPEPLPFCDDSA